MSEPKTVQGEWKRYVDHCHPDVPAERNRELHEAFFMGALAFVNLMDQAAKLPPAECEKQSRRHVHEVLDTCEARIMANKARN